ncbi:hypothetical protein ACYVU7_12180 [Arenicellales bacterium IMCC56312]
MTDETVNDELPDEVIEAEQEEMFKRSQALLEELGARKFFWLWAEMSESLLVEEGYPSDVLIMAIKTSEKNYQDWKDSQGS